MDYKLIREFYNNLQDEESRYIFDCRINFLFNGDRGVLFDMVRNVNKRFHPPKIIRDIKWLTGHKNDISPDVIIYGAGEMAEKCLKLACDAGLNVIAFCDRAYEKWNDKTHFGLPVISPQELSSNKEYRKCIVIISSILFYEDICASLFISGRTENEIYLMEDQYRFTDYIYRPSYFEQEFFIPTEEGVYIDAGCYNGSTIREFVNFCDGNYKKIYGFEPQPEQYKNTVEDIKKWNIKNCEILEKGAWSEDDELSFHFHCAGPGGSRIDKDGKDCIVKTTSIDKVAGEDKVTFIKMDIETAELEALKGARNTILRDKPKLAICIYHKPEDIIEIPEFLYKLMPEYKFYIRHHKNTGHGILLEQDTVLYAV